MDFSSIVTAIVAVNNALNKIAVLHELRDSHRSAAAFAKIHEEVLIAHRGLLGHAAMLLQGQQAYVHATAELRKLRDVIAERGGIPSFRSGRRRFVYRANVASGESCADQSRETRPEHYACQRCLDVGMRFVLQRWFWMRVFNDMRTRGTQDILIAVTDGLKGIPEALKAVFPQTALQTCILQADGYPGFAQLYAKGTIQEAACWAHARRKFYVFYKDQASPLAREVLQRIAALYAIESEIRGQPPDQRKAVRQGRASPLLVQLHVWLNQTLTQLSKNRHWAVRSFMPQSVAGADGRIEIDNNAAERALRGVALGRKNYLSVGSGAGGERAAAIYSLVGSAELSDLNPQVYLTHVLERIAEQQINRVDELLPWNVSLTLTELREAA